MLALLEDGRGTGSGRGAAAARHCTRRGETGFTLVEMLVVLGIIVTVAGISLPIFLSARIGTRRTNAENALRAALSAARQAAIERRTTVAVEFDSTACTMTIYDKTAPSQWTGGDRRIGQQIVLPAGIVFDNMSGNKLTSGKFLPYENLTTMINGWTYDPLDETGPVDVFGNGLPDIVFLADGSIADQQGTTDIALLDTTESNSHGKPLADVFTVLPATGLVIEKKHCEDPTQVESASNVSGTGWL